MATTSISCLLYLSSCSDVKMYTGDLHFYMRHSFHPAPPPSTQKDQDSSIPSKNHPPRPKANGLQKQSRFQAESNTEPKSVSQSKSLRNALSGAMQKDEPSSDSDASVSSYFRGLPKSNGTSTHSQQSVKKGTGILTPEIKQSPNSDSETMQKEQGFEIKASMNGQRETIDPVMISDSKPRRRGWKGVAEEAFRKLHLTAKAGPIFRAENQSGDFALQDVYGKRPMLSQHRSLSRIPSFNSSLDNQGSSENATTSGLS